MGEKDHHVAWADRIGLNKRWADAIKDCFENYNTPGFKDSVEAFEALMVNIHEGPPLYNNIQKYKQETLTKDRETYIRVWKKKHPDLAQNRSYLKDLNIEIRKIENKKIFHFILQMLEDNKFGFYKSTFDGEYDKWE